MPLQEWEEFLKMRTRIKSPVTDHGKKLLINKLSKLKEEGGDPCEILQQSTMNSWKGLFSVNGNDRKSTNQEINEWDRYKQTREKNYGDYSG